MELILKTGGKINCSDEILEIEALLKKYCLCNALITVIKSKASMGTKQQCAGELNAQGIEFDLSKPLKYQTKSAYKKLKGIKTHILNMKSKLSEKETAAYKNKLRWSV